MSCSLCPELGQVAPARIVCADEVENGGVAGRTLVGDEICQPLQRVLTAVGDERKFLTEFVNRLL